MLVFLFVATMAVQAAEPDDAQVAARAKALELAGAFANEGYKLRDGVFYSDLQAATPKVFVVNLFAGNEYWFSAASSSSEARMRVEVFDNEGQPLDANLYEDGEFAACGVEPVASGRYYVRVSPVSASSDALAVVYSYK